MRELAHVVERAVLMANGSLIEQVDVVPSAGATASPVASSSGGALNLEQSEQAMIRQALTQCEGNIQRTAQRLGLSRGALYRRMEKYGLEVTNGSGRPYEPRKRIVDTTIPSDERGDTAMATILNTVCLMAMAIEISAAKWIVASVANSTSKIRRKSLDQEQAKARFEALLEEITTARKHLQVPEEARVLVAYEAGQEGFWLVRALRARGIEAEVIDPVSLPVDRRARRVKTDRVDAEALTAALWRYASGDCRALRMVRVPDEASEASREWQRERERLEGERRGCTDRIVKKLHTHGIWPLPKSWRADLRAQRLHLFSGKALPAMLSAMLSIELDRLEAAEAKLKELQDKLALLDPAARARIDALVRLRAVGPVGARGLATLLFWRDFNNRRQVGACVGLVGTPYDSGTLRQDQGISKAGDPKLRALLVEMAWMWLRYQPGSAISTWFAQRTQGGGKRAKRVMIVAVARKLAIALWRYLKHGEIPQGARLKACVA